jgi:hypothetical protein
MTAALVIERERIVRPREDRIASRLRRFAWRHREAVSALARRHPRLADLALSFPALLFALAVPRRRFDPELVIERVIAGAPLSELAKDADIPMWTRRLMPEAFLHPIPDLPDSEFFRHQIANYLPETSTAAHRWVLAVSNASAWGHDALAVWVARHLRRGGKNYALEHWRLLCLWAWHCAHRDAPAARYVTSQWTPDMSPRQAIDIARDWANSVLTVLKMGEIRIEDAWAKPATIDGYAFEPVLTADDLVGHALRLHNCARRYAVDMASNSMRIWVIRKDREVIGMIRLAAEYQQPYPALAEVRGVRNGRLDPEILMAAHRWYRFFAPLRPPARNVRYDVQPPGAGWRRMWRAYWLDRRRLPGWLGMACTRRMWGELLDVDFMRTLRRRRWRR